jgi:hypothetical protein
MCRCACGTLAPDTTGKALPFDTMIGRRLDRVMAAFESLPDASAVPGLARRIGRVEHECLVIRRRLFPGLRIAPPSRLPVRQAATHGLDSIALDLQRAGLLDFRHAQKVVRGVRDAWKAALARGERVLTPAGFLSVRKLRSGRRVFLKPAAQLRLAVEPERTQKTAPMPPIPNTESLLPCARCGGQWFTEQVFQRYKKDSYQDAVHGPTVPIGDSRSARICLCGIPLEPRPYGGGRQQQGDDRSFLESAQRAQKYLRQLSEAEERMGKRLQEAVHAEFVKQLAARLEAAEREVADLTVELHGRQLKPRRKHRRRPVPAEGPTPAEQPD